MKIEVGNCFQFAWKRDVFEIISTPNKNEKTFNMRKNKVKEIYEENITNYSNCVMQIA